MKLFSLLWYLACLVGLIYYCCVGNEQKAILYGVLALINKERS